MRITKQETGRKAKEFSSMNEATALRTIRLPFPVVVSWLSRSLRKVLTMRLNLIIGLMLVFSLTWSEEPVLPLHEDKSIKQLIEMDLDVLHHEIIFQNRLLNGKDETDILNLLDGADGRILNAAISALMHTKNRNGLIRIIDRIETSSEKTRTNIYAVIPYVGLPEWKTLIQKHLKTVNDDTKSKYVPLREYSAMLLSGLVEK